MGRIEQMIALKNAAKITFIKPDRKILKIKISTSIVGFLIKDNKANEINMEKIVQMSDSIINKFNGDDIEIKINTTFQFIEDLILSGKSFDIELVKQAVILVTDMFDELN